MNIFLKIKYKMALICFCFIGFSQPALAKDKTPLTWAPPVQEYPTKIEIEYSQNPTILNIKRSQFPYKKDEVQEVQITDVVTLKFNDDEDAIITLPRDKILAIPGLLINYGRNIRIIGGHVIATQSANETLRAVLRFRGQSGSVFAEGLLIDTNRQYGLDGILVGGVNYKPESIANIYIQNCLIKGVTSTQKGLHADGFQYYGPTKWTYMDRVSIISQYQGLFLDPQNDIDGIDLRRIDLRNENASTAAGYLFFLRVEKNQPRHPVVKLKDIYVEELKNRTPWEDWSIYPPTNRSNGARLKGDNAYFPFFPEVEGYVTKGSPPNGPWVTEKDVGLDYQSPGYKKI